MCSWWTYDPGICNLCILLWCWCFCLIEHNILVCLFLLIWGVWDPNTLWYLVVRLDPRGSNLIQRLTNSNHVKLSQRETDSATLELLLFSLASSVLHVDNRLDNIAKENKFLYSSIYFRVKYIVSSWLF